MQTWHDRFEYARAQAGLSVAEVARRAGIEPGTLRAALNKRADTMRGDAFDRIADVLQVERLWLKEGVSKGEMTLAEPYIQGQPNIVIPIYGVLAQSGSCNYVGESTQTGEFYLPIGVLPFSHEGLGCVEVIGDSMTPTLAAGQKIIIDFHQTSPSPPGMYLVDDGYGAVVKRVEYCPTERVVHMTSDNKIYKDISVMIDDLGESTIKIIGKVVLIMISA